MENNLTVNFEFIINNVSSNSNWSVKSTLIMIIKIFMCRKYSITIWQPAQEKIDVVNGFHH